MNTELVWRQVQDENTPSEILTELANSKEPEILRCIAKNPNTPTETLAKLCIDFPDEVAENPIYNQLRSENVNIKFPILSLARRCKVSAQELVEHANQKGVIILDTIILNNPKTSGKTIDKIYDGDGRRLGFRLFLEHENTEDITLEKIVTGSSYNSNSKFAYDGKNIHNRIVEHPNASRNTIHISKLRYGDLLISPCILEKLSNHKNPSIRSCVSRHPNTSTKTLEKLSLDDVGQAPEFVAKNHNTSKDIIINLTKNNNNRARKSVAQRRNLSLEIANILSKDVYFGVRVDIAENPKTPRKIIDSLVEDSSHYVREAVAGRKNISLEQATILAHDISWQVIEKLLNNTNVNVPARLYTLLEALENQRNCRLSNNYIRIYPRSIREYYNVLSTISIPEKAAKKMTETKSIFVRRLLAINPNISISIFRKLSSDSETRVLLGLTHNINTPPEILEELAKSTVCSIRKGVAENFQVTSEILDKLKGDRNISVREQVANNLKISLQTIEYLSTDSSPLVRKAIAKNPQTPVAVLDRLKSDCSQSVRLAIAENPHTSTNTLKELLNDEALKIKQSVYRKLGKAAS